MAKNFLEVKDEVVVRPEDFERLLDTLKREGYQTLGPTIRQNAIIYDELKSIADLPVGWNDVQEAGTYRLGKNDAATFFGYVVGPHSWKKYLHPPVVRLWQANKDEKGFQVVEENYQIPKYAFIGVRSCDINAITILDKVFNTKEFSDTIYNSRRQKTMIVAVNCTRPAGTCFCVSMNTGPKVKSNFDIALTEVLHGGQHYFNAEVGSEKGARVLSQFAFSEASVKQKQAARGLLEQASRQMGRALNTSNLNAIFYEHFEHPQWEEVAGRCLTCGNCTLVCPTCFCNNIVDVNSMSGKRAERWRKWDSCFTKDFSYIHGGSIRASEKSRYRHWLTHKLATWMDQFGRVGCVGCGRCITWCPVGIDITEEAKSILEGAVSSG
ncbi:MAG: 4Fe-4S dicluster domain-containing protein [Desulfobacteraceae bacterium]